MGDGQTSSIKLIIGVTIVGVLGAGIYAADLPERAREFRDGDRQRDLESLQTSINTYIKNNSGGTINLGLVGKLYTSDSLLTRVDGSGWVPLDFKGSGVSLKKLPLDPLNTGEFTYTFTSSSGLRYKISTTFESKQFARKAKDDTGTNPSRFELGTELTLKP